MHYDAIKAGRKVWEARPSYQLRKGAWCESSFSQLAAVGRVVVLQSGAGTNDLASVVEFRRYEEHQGHGWRIGYRPSTGCAQFLHRV